jgi:L-asparaginase
MVDTARFLADKVPGKTVVLTGGMIPYTFGSSDGLFNLGSALSFAQVLQEGVFIAMNGRFFHAHQVRKDRRRGIVRQSAGNREPHPRRRRPGHHRRHRRLRLFQWVMSSRKWLQE